MHAKGYSRVVTVHFPLDSPWKALSPTEKLQRSLAYRGKTPTLRALFGIWLPWGETYSEYVTSRQSRPFLFDGGDLPDKDVRRTTLAKDRARERRIVEIAQDIRDAEPLIRLDLAELVALREQVLRFLQDVQAPTHSGESFMRGHWAHCLLMQRILDGRDARAAMETALSATDDGPLLSLLELDAPDRVDADFLAGFAAANQELARFVEQRLESQT